MSAVTLLTYIWHYLVARMIYDQLVRPVMHGDLAGIALLGCVAALAFTAGRWTVRRRHPRLAGAPRARTW
jgi:hypothetical protein